MSKWMRRKEEEFKLAPRIFIRTELNMNLHKALLKGDFSVIRQLVESGVNVNWCDADGRTALMLCCLHEGEDWAVGVARMLLMHKGYVGLSDSQGRSALIYAVLYERLGLVQMFLQALDFDLNACDLRGKNALDYAYQTGNQGIRKLLLQAMRRCGSMSGHSVVNPVNQKLFHSEKSFKSDSSIRFTNLLPYKTLPKELWTNRKTTGRLLRPKYYALSKGTTNGASGKIKVNEILKGGKISSPSLQNPQIDSCKKFQSFVSVQKHPPDSQSISKTIQNPKLDTINNSKTLGPKHCSASKSAVQSSKEKPGIEKYPPITQKTWTLDMRALMDALQAQNSTSYRPKAQPHPRVPRQRHRPKLLHRHKGRKMSLGALDHVLEKKKQISFHRRCTLASIPIIQQSKGRKPGIPGLENLTLGGERNSKPSKTVGNS